MIVPDRDGVLVLSDDQVAVLCDRRFGIGGDGILRVVRAAAIDEGAEAAASGVEVALASLRVTLFRETGEDAKSSGDVRYATFDALMKTPKLRRAA